MSKYSIIGNKGIKATPNESVKWGLQTTDGTYFGDVSYEAYKAAESGTLSSYKPKTKEEKEILDNFRLRTGAEIKKDDGTSIFISLDGIKAIEENNIDNYTPINKEEEKAIKSYIEYATQKRKEKIDNYKTVAKQKLVDTEKEKSKAAEEASALRREKASAKRSTGLSSGGTDWVVKDTRTAKEKREGKSITQSSGQKKLDTAVTKYRNLDEEADALVETIADIDKYADITYKDTGIIGQAQANYTQGRLSQDTAQAYNDYVVSPTESNRMRAEALSALTEEFVANNQNALTTDDEEVSKFAETIRDWVGVSFAGYLPQLIDQTKASIKGAVIGGATGATVGSVVPGIGTATGLTYGLKTGWVSGASQQMFETTRGMVFKTLVDAGYDEETALEAANDEAFVSSIIEGCGEVLSMVTLGTGKIVNKIAPEAVKKVSSNVVVNGIKGFAQKTGKKITENAFLRTTAAVAGVVANAAGEYVEEYSQEAVSIANERRLKNGNSLLGETYNVLRDQDESTRARLQAAGTEGFRIGLMSGGATKVGMSAGESASSHISNAITGMKIKNAGVAQDVIGVGLNQSADTQARKLAEKLNSSDKTSAPKLGKLAKANKGESVNVGETYYDTKTGAIYNVVSRDANNTTILMTSSDGRSVTKAFPNASADNITSSNRYVMVASEVETPAYQTTVADVTTTETPIVAENTTVEQTTPVETDTDVSETTEEVVSQEETADVSAPMDINLKRTGNYYVAFGDEAIALAKELKEPTKKTVVNGVETDVLRFPADLMLKAAPTMSDEFNFVFSDKPQTKASENSPVVNETVATDETTSSDAETEAEVKKANVINAINDTLTPEAKKDLSNGEIKDNLGRVADVLMEVYKSQGTIEGFENFFTDNGAEVISVLEGKVDDQTQETSKANSNDVLKNQSESDTIEEKTEDETSNDSDVVGPRVESPSVNVGDVYTNNKTGDVYTVANRDSENTTVYIKNKKGVTTTIIPNVLADDSFNVEDTFTKVTEKDTKSTTEPKAVESEENGNGRKRDSILPENSGRANNGSTQKQTERFSNFERRNKGKNESERQSFARDLIERGQVESVSDGECEYILVKPEAYNDDMVSMVEDAKSKGVELGFIIGDAKVFGDGKDFYVDGIKFNNSKVIVRYDGTRTPQKLAKHELAHAKWNTPEVQKAKNAILDSLTEEKKQEILSQERYARYKSETYNGSEEIALEEFVCDVMAGMNDYTENYNDVVSEYWNENETVEGYNPSTYAESTDAGGDNKFSFSSMGATFFGDENISAKDFEKMVEDGSYKNHKGYRDFVKDCVDVYKQSRGVKGMLPGSEVKKIEQQIEGIMKVAIAAKKAGYDIYDDGKARSKKDSKKRLLFSSLEPNSDYVTSSDVSTICDKAKNFTEIYDGIVNLEEERGVPADKRFFNNVDNYFILHKLLADKGLTIPCDECYVQALRKNLTPMANAFVELVTEENSDNKDNAQLYHQEGKDKGNIKKNNAEIRDKVRELCSQSDCPIKLEDLTPKLLTTADGLTELRLEAPLVYEAFNSFYGQSKPKMPKKATPFRPGELIAMFTNSKGEIKTSLVNKIKATGGFRLQSYGDFQIENYVDVLQTIFEAGMIGLNGHAYTKVPAFLEATDGTNLKRNISIFMYEDGDNWVIDKKNSFPMELEDIYSLVASDESGNTGIIALSQNEDMSAWIMANELLGYGIPFHKSATRMDVVRGRVVKTPDGREILGYANQKDHTKQQTEVYSKTLSDKKKENTKVKNPINIYSFWDFKNKDNLSKNELIEKNVKRYIDECNKRDYRPKFREYVMDNEAVLDKVLHYAKQFGYVPQNATVEDISFKYGEYTIPYGYYKFLGDFGMFTPDGKAVPIETLSLENYDFDKAVDFFKDSEKLRANELLQQFENGKVRDEYRKMINDGDLTIEQLENILKEKRNEVVQAVVNGTDGAAKGKLTNSEWNEFYRSLGELERGLWFPQTSDGDYIFETSDKLIFTDGNYSEPKVNNVVVFEGLNAEEIEYGKETIWNYAETGKSCEECCEIAQAMLGKGAITSTNPYSGIAYRGGKNSSRQRRYSFAVDNENDSEVRLSFAEKAEREYAPTFYSHMGKVIDEIKQDKIGANSVISYLKGKGVKNEEIKWTGIEEFLEGKKSVTKAELQEFVAGSQLQIEENTLYEDGTIDYTEEESSELDFLSELISEKWEEMNTLWEEKYGEEISWDIRFADDDVYRLREELKKRYKSSDKDSFYEDISKRISEIARADLRVLQIKGRAEDRFGKDGTSKSKWHDYKLDGGENYREITFKMPNSDYSNSMMRTHWGEDAKGILAHARIQDFDIYGKKMLFIEEIQSDWHNAGHKNGYKVGGFKPVSVSDTNLSQIGRVYYLCNSNGEVLDSIHDNAVEFVLHLNATEEEIHELLIDEYNRTKGSVSGQTPDAPFKDNYHEYVLKNLIRMAAEQGYDSIGWTPAEIQSERWSYEFAEGYRIEYDQDIPKFLNKYGKKWGAKVGHTEIRTEEDDWYDADGTKVWSMPITDSMKESVLYEGQPRYSFSEERNLDTQKKIESIAEEIGSHEEFISIAKQNTKEFVDKIKQNESLQKRLNNAKRQMLLSPKPAVNAVQVGKITKEILAEMDSTLKATDLKDEVMSIYNEYFAEIKQASGVESKVQTANDNMMDRFAKLAVDIINSSEALTESENYESLKSYVRNTRIRVPDSAKADAHYAEFRKSHMGTFNLTNDGLDIDVAYMELCGMFPGIFNEEITHPADQLNEIANVLENLKPYAYNPHLEYMEDAVDHVVFRFASEVDGLAAMPKTKAQKIAEKSAYDKEMALEKEKAKFEQKLDRHKRDSENLIRKLQKKIDDADYVSYWDKRLSKEEKAQAVQKVRDKRDVAILKSKIRSIVSDMKKNLDKTEKAGGYPKELVQAAAEVCSVLDFHTDKTQKDGSPTKVSLKLDTLKMEYDALKNNPNYDFASEYSKELSDQIEELRNLVKNKRVVDLKKSELSKLKDILSEISQRLSNARKQIGLDAVKLNADMAEEIIESLNSKNDVADMNQKLILKKGKLAVQWAKAFLLNPHRVNKMIAGYDMDSAWWQLQDALNRGNRKAGKFLMEATKPFDELTDGGGNEIAFYDFRTKKIKTGIKYTDGSEVEIPKSIICEMVMMWDRKDGRTHLESGGATIPDVELYNKGDTLNAITGGKRTLPITATDIARLKETLDSYDKTWIERAHHLFNKVSKDATNETSLQLVGRELATEENYIRMYVNQDFVGKEIGKDQDGNITLEGHGSLKETKPQAKQPLLFRGLHENVYDNIDFTSKYYGLAIPIRNFNKVYQMTFRNENGQSSVREIIGKKFGAEIRNKVVEQYIKELQTPRKRDLSIFDTFRGRWLGATFWGNISSTLKQTSSYWSGAAMLSEDSLVKGLKNFAKSPKRTKAEINRYSGTLYKRSQGLSTTELGDRANRKRLAGASSKITKFINEKAPKLRNIPQGLRPENWLQAMDVNTSAALWEACKIEIAKTMNTSDESYMQAVTDLWESVIEETQSNYDVAHRPESLKSTNPITQTVTMFTTDIHQKFGLLFSAFDDYKTKSELHEKDATQTNQKAMSEAGTRLVRASLSAIYSSLWMGAVSVLAHAILRKFKPYIDDEEKDITAGSVAKQYMMLVGEDLFNTAMPVGGSIISSAWNTFNKGYDFVSVPSVDVIEDFLKAMQKVYKASTEENGDVLGAIKDSAYAISNFTGVPVKNISDLLGSIKGYAGDIIAGDFAHDLSDYTSGNKSFYNYGDLASYIVSGNKEKETKWLEYYSENGKEIAKGSLTKEIKPAYVQMYIESPEKAENIKRKLILDYDYTGATIDDWGIAEYLKNIVSDFEYAEEIKGAMQKRSAWKSQDVYKDIKKYYKDVYKSGDKKETNKLKDALLKSDGTYKNSFSGWEKEADSEIKKTEDAKNKEKAKYK